MSKHLSYKEREFIEIGLNNNRNYTDIAKDLNKDRTTIAKEIKKHSFKKIPSSFNNSANFCMNKIRCKKFDCTKEMNCYQEELCNKLTKRVHVCNGCLEKTKCRKIKYYYYAKFANNEYVDKLVNSRVGINLTKSEVYELDRLISPLIKEKNQSINHIYANHQDEIFFSKPTLYAYIESGVLSVRNIDLPRKVKYKPRKNTQKQRIRRETVVRNGRIYEDYIEYISKNPEASIVEMDTVEGKKGGKVFLTLLLKSSKLMLIYLLESKNMECVENVFIQLKKLLGNEIFKKIFGVILTDNGSEFLNPTSIEKSEDGNEILTQVFYCEPSASWQKGSIEKNHEYIRYVLPKGNSFDRLTQKEVDILANNINSTSRDSLNGGTPYNASKFLIDEEVLKKLNIKKIEADQVNLSPSLLKEVITDGLE